MYQINAPKRKSAVASGKSHHNLMTNHHSPHIQPTEKNHYFLFYFSFARTEIRRFSTARFWLILTQQLVLGRVFNSTWGRSWMNEHRITNAFYDSQPRSSCCCRAVNWIFVALALHSNASAERREIARWAKLELVARLLFQTPWIRPRRVATDRWGLSTHFRRGNHYLIWIFATIFFWIYFLLPAIQAPKNRTIRERIWPSTEASQSSIGSTGVSVWENPLSLMVIAHQFKWDNRT